VKHLYSIKMATYMILWLIGISASAQTLDLADFTGTMEVEFQPVQSAGIREGCALVYRVVTQDFTQGKADLVSLAGNIHFGTNKQRSSVGLSLKIGAKKTLDPNAKIEPPFFAYLQSSHGTTARSQHAKFDSPDTPGFRVFMYALDDNVMKVYKDIAEGVPITIGFNRREGGMDILVPLDLGVAETTMKADGSYVRRRSDDMVLKFLDCVTDISRQVKDKIQ
jgi:hypothetical protein